jgi:hypothetical protein
MKLLRITRNFAANVGITFHTPEEYFLHEKPRPFTRDFDPTVYIDEHELVDRPTSACMFEHHQPLGTSLYPLRADFRTQHLHSRNRIQLTSFSFVAARVPGNLLTIGETFNHWGIVG